MAHHYSPLSVVSGVLVTTIFSGRGSASFDAFGTFPYRPHESSTHFLNTNIRVGTNRYPTLMQLYTIHVE